MLRPFVSAELCWIVSHHPLFQMHYYGAQSGDDVNARDAYREHPWFGATVEIAPAVEEVFSHEPAFRWSAGRVAWLGFLGVIG